MHEAWAVVESCCGRTTADKGQQLPMTTANSQLLGEMTAAAEKEAQDSFDDDEAGFGQPRAGALPINPH